MLLLAKQFFFPQSKKTDLLPFEVLHDRVSILRLFSSYLPSEAAGSRLTFSASGSALMASLDSTYFAFSNS